MISLFPRLSVFLLFFLNSCCCFSLDEPTMQHRLDELVQTNAIPGANFSVINADGKQLDFSSGFADTLSLTALNMQHVLFSGSIGKTYAVAVLMQLVEEGKIDLERRFLEYFPDSPWLENIPGIDKITLEMLLQHTSGLPRYITAQALWDTLQNNPDKIWDYLDRLSYTFEMGSVHEPGEGWAYSDTNYLLLGMLIEEITGAYYYDEVRERILMPARLNQTHPSTRRDMPNLPVGYSRLPAFFRIPGTVVTDGKYLFNPQMEWTGGGFASTTSDLAKWAELYYENALFSSASLEKIITPTPQGAHIGPNEAYGMGSFIFDTKLGIAYGHSGFMPGFNSIFAYFPEYQTAVALQVNCDYASQKISLVEYLEILLEGVIDK